MPEKAKANIFQLLSSSISTFLEHPVILAPFITLGFIQLFIIELLYFAPRWPLSVFFAPIIRKMEGEVFLHYPYHFIVIPKFFQIFQIPIFLFISCCLFASAVYLINEVNRGKKPKFSAALRASLSQYVHLFVAALISFGIFFAIYKGYGLLIARALKISSTSGIYFWIKTVVIQGAPYFNLILGALVTAVFAYVYPVIILEKSKVFRAIAQNFKLLFRRFFSTILLVLIPTFFYMPFILIRTNINAFTDVTFPEMRVIFMVLSVLLMLCVDAVVYTAITTNYLLMKERS